MTFERTTYLMLAIMAIGGGLTEGFLDEGTGYLLGMTLGCLVTLHLWKRAMKD